MRATAIEFRLRLTLMVIVIVLGFWSPWIETWHVGQRVSLFEWSAVELSRLRLLPFTAASPTMIVIAILLAAAGAVLRVWGAACLSPAIVTHSEMKAGSVLAGGPYRYVRNPLYLGSWCMVAAMSFLMPPTGALFTMALLSVFLLRLILGEEAFLAARLGEPYIAYRRAVPRLFPRLRTNLPRAGNNPVWGRALISELYPIGVFLILAVLSWRYDNRLMLRALLICFGVSLVVRALIPGIRSEPGDQPA